MNKVKIFFFAAALTLVTAGVFAGNHRFSGTGLYLVNGTNVKTLETVLPADLTISNPAGQPATIFKDQAGVGYTAEAYNSSNILVPVYTTF